MEPGGQSNYHPERLAQYTDIIEYVQEKYGVKIRGNYIACVKRESNNKPKPGKAKGKPYCPANKVEYIKDALRHFGILTN